MKDKMKLKCSERKITLERRLQFMTHKNNLHYALRWTLFCSRIMGILPVSGVLNPVSTGLRFTFKSPYTLFYITAFCGQIIFSTLSFYWLLQNGPSLANITNTVFYISSLTNFLILANLARCWPKMISIVEEMENKLPPITRNVSKYCYLTTGIILVLALVEHGLSILYGESSSKSCHMDNFGESYFVLSMPWIFHHISYSLWKGILFEFFNIQSTFIWSYSDLLIMVLSLYLSEHLYLHYHLLKKSVKQEHFSADIFRTHFLKISQLVNYINCRFGLFVVLSFGTNLYWICTQLFNTLKKSNTGHIVALDCTNKDLQEYKIHGVKHTIYFLFSFSFLVARTLLILLLAARVNTNSMAPLTVMYELPTSKFNVEVERYIDQINNLKVAISGYGFFYITRTMILTLLGSIITYELVLLQFSKN